MVGFIMRSLRLKLIIGITFILALFILVWQYFDSKAFKQAIYQNLMNNCENMVEVVDKIWEEYMLTHKIGEAKQAIQNISEIERVKLIYFMNRQGKVRFSSEPKLLGSVYAQEQRRQVENTDKPYFELLEKDKKHYFLSLTPMENKPECQHCHKEPKVIGYLGLDLNVEKEVNFISQQYAARMKRISLLGPFFYILIIGSIFLFLLVNVHQPVEIIRKGLDKVKEGIYGEKIVIKSIDEIGELADSFNHMTETLQQTAEQLIRSAKMSALGHLAAGVGHELHTHLSRIRTDIHYLRTRFAKDKPELIQAVDDIDRQINYTGRTVSNILHFAGPIELQLKPTNLNLSLEEAILQADKENLFQKVKINKKLAPQLPILDLDQERIKQAFYSLIVNACEAMPEGGELTITTTAEQKSVKITVNDTGYGIPEKDLKDLFSPFFTTKSKGMGLGLTIVKKNIEEHHGKVEVESVVGKGTTFTIELPVVRQV